MTHQRKQLGAQGEQWAREELEKRGYRVLETNWRSYLGELDIIAQKEGKIVFVEVKTKTGLGYGSPEEMVDRRKQWKLIRTAESYLEAQDLQNADWRIDVVAIGLDSAGRPKIELIENAVERH